MRLFACGLAAAALTSISAQYGTFDASVLKEASTRSTVVVLDDGTSGYNQAIMSAMKADWKFNGQVDFITLRDLGTQPLDPTRNYLLRIHRSDKEKHDAVFLALCKGWKQKKDEALVVEDGAVKNMPAAHELASIMIDPKVLGAEGSALANVYVKHLQNYMKLVMGGKITDRTTADRLYDGRTKTVKEKELWIAAGHMDKTVPDVAAARETYTHTVEVVPFEQILEAVAAGKSGVAFSDVVITGADKTQWCFKRVFDAGTGELLYLRDDAALHGKKLGFISEDLRIIEQSR